MTKTSLEHVNVTVSNPEATAAWLDAVFDWKIRWQGDSINGGRSAHVGGADSYVALYTPPKSTHDAPESYYTRGGLNHIAVTVDDLDGVEARVKAAGFTPTSHADYEPGRRFYFHDHDQIEWEVVCYDQAA